MKSLRTIALGGTLAMASVSACSQEPLNPPEDTVRELLLLHDLWGKTPEERSDANRTRPVDAKELAPLFSDLPDGDPFLQNLYVGFLAGALARHQQHLVYTAEGDTVEVRAGDVRVIMRRQSNRYRICLAESIPEVVRQLAEAEKQRLLATPR